MGSRGMGVGQSGGTSFLSVGSGRGPTLRLEVVAYFVRRVSLELQALASGGSLRALGRKGDTIPRLGLGSCRDR